MTLSVVLQNCFSNRLGFLPSNHTLLACLHFAYPLVMSKSNFCFFSAILLIKIWHNVSFRHFKFNTLIFFTLKSTKITLHISSYHHHHHHQSHNPIYLELAFRVLLHIFISSILLIFIKPLATRTFVYNINSANLLILSFVVHCL